jgi:hypothetical protein
MSIVTAENWSLREVYCNAYKHYVVILYFTHPEKGGRFMKTSPLTKLSATEVTTYNGSVYKLGTPFSNRPPEIKELQALLVTLKEESPS